MKIAIIGGGAAGFFAAISCKTNYPDAEVVIFEKSAKLLSKVRVSGGGRCNVTHACFNISKLIKYYPRGQKKLKKMFNQFSTTDTIAWFKNKGVELKTEQDNRMFPVTDRSQTIIDCLVETSSKLGIKIQMQNAVSSIIKTHAGFMLNDLIFADKIIVAPGGSPKLQGFDWLKALGHHIVPPVPSLFTFNMPSESVKALMGLSVDNVAVKVQGTKLKAEGPLLITHWGMSGPAVLKLSAFGARILHDMNYRFNVQVSWLGPAAEQEVRQLIDVEAEKHAKRKVEKRNPYGLPNRLWVFLMEKAAIRSNITWGELGSKGINRLVNILLNDVYKVEGKTTFKEEFVTCGGVSLEDIDIRTMESKISPGLYFAGEVLDIDGVTGGFNFQAAWTTGYIAGKSVGGS